MLFLLSFSSKNKSYRLLSAGTLMGPNVSLSSLKVVESDLLYVIDMRCINEDAVDGVGMLK